jgi:hypothetical protein
MAPAALVGSCEFGTGLEKANDLLASVLSSPCQIGARSETSACRRDERRFAPALQPLVTWTEPVLQGNGVSMCLGHHPTSCCQFICLRQQIAQVSTVLFRVDCAKFNAASMSEYVWVQWPLWVVSRLRDRCLPHAVS